MGIARAWVMAGHRITGVWYPARFEGTEGFLRDRARAMKAPGISMHGIAARAGLKPLAVGRLSTADVDAARASGADVIISLTFMGRIPTAMLASFPGRVFNLHPSLLPQYRGANPVMNMLWDGRQAQASGATLHLVSEEFDTGDIVARAEVPFPADSRLGDYFMRMVGVAGPMLADGIARCLAGDLVPVAQAARVPEGESRLRPDQAMIGSQMPGAQAGSICRTVAQMVPVRFEDVPPYLAAVRMAGRIGDPTGAGARLTGSGLQYDLSDGRYVFAVKDIRIRT